MTEDKVMWQSMLSQTKWLPYNRCALATPSNDSLGSKITTSKVDDILQIDPISRSH